MITIYTDGSCLGNPGPGGWAAVINDNGDKRSLSGKENNTTNNRMEILAAIKGLQAVPASSEVTVFSDSQYVVNTMSRGWKRNANRDLWAALDAAAGQRKVTWQWTRGHAGNPGNEEANALALQQAQSFLEGNSPLTHLDSQGNAQMVDVSGKDATLRNAVAEGLVYMKPSTLRLIKEGGIDKGDVLAVARVAGIMAAKRTSELIPMCHPVPLDRVAIQFDLDAPGAIRITASARTTAKTGVEMEALTAVNIAALTIYDMAKAVDRAMKISEVRLVSKSGGRSGDYFLEPAQS